MADSIPILNTKNQVADLYNRVAADYGQIGPKILDHFGQRLIQLTGISPGSRVLDIGSGRGASLLPAAQAVQSTGFAIGADIAFQMASEAWHECHRASLTNVHLLQMDGDYLSFRSSSCDYIFCGFAIFFFPNPEHTLQEWYRVLKTTGKLGICVADSGDEEWQWYEELLFKYHKQYQFPLSANVGGLRKPSEIKELMEKAGFHHTEILREPYEFIYADEAQWWQAKWTHGARFPLEQMGKEVLAIFKEDVFAHLQQSKESTGLRERWQLAYIIGSPTSQL